MSDCASAEKNGEEHEEVLTLQEVMQRDAVLTEAANAVLGNLSDSSCTYAMGYFRQPIYACMTCIPSSSDVFAGICLACSYHCHPDHELVELYTKRDFCCDCGNSKFSTSCTLSEDKEPVNGRNKYNHNFKGQYCICRRPYPDPEAKVPEVMLQCIVCEDWLHEQHISGDLVNKEGAKGNEDSIEIPAEFDEFICAVCMKGLGFLADYQKNDSDIPHDACKIPKYHTKCKEQAEATDDAMPTFWKYGWRESLCQCSRCMRLYEDRNITFLLSQDDTIQAYEESNQQDEAPSVEQAAQNAFSAKLSHEQQIEMAIGYNHMKSKLQKYLEQFAQEDKTVKAEDIHNFFDALRNKKKRQKVEP